MSHSSANSRVNGRTTIGLTYRDLPDLLLCELLAPADLADLVALVVAAGRAVAAVVLPLAADALSAALPLLLALGLLLIEINL